jgi:phosphoglycolate phosphatase
MPLTLNSELKTLNCKAIIFDFDGTLAMLNVDFQLMRKSILNLLSSYGVEPEGLQELFVLEMIEAGRKILDQVSTSDGTYFDLKAYELIRDIEEEGARHSHLIPGIREMLMDLKSLDIGIGIATRNCREAVMAVFPEILSFCGALVSRESTHKVKPHPEHLFMALRNLGVEAKLSAMVGDHPIDIVAGRKAGSFTIGVLTGYSKADALSEAGADLIIESAAHLIHYLP